MASSACPWQCNALLLLSDYIWLWQQNQRHLSRNLHSRCFWFMQSYALAQDSWRHFQRTNLKRGTKLIWCMTDKAHNSILIYYVFELNRFVKAGKLCLSPCDVFQKINCIYRSLWTVSLLVLCNPLKSLKQLLFFLSEVVEYITKWADMCGITFLMFRACLGCRTWAE